MRFFLIMAGILGVNNVVSQPLFTSIPAAPSAYSLKQQDVFCFLSNPANLASCTLFTAGVLTARPFMVKQLGFYQAAFLIPTSGGIFGVSGIYNGNAFYNQASAGLAYARKMHKLSAGVQFNYHATKTSGYGLSGAITMSGGMVAEITEKFRMGWQVFNPMRAAVGKTGDRLPVVCSIGMGLDASENFYGGIEVIKEEDHPVRIKAGVQYQVHRKLMAAAGLTTSPSHFYIVTGFCLKEFQVRAIASFHPYLGITPGVGIIYRSNETK